LGRADVSVPGQERAFAHATDDAGEVLQSSAHRVGFRRVLGNRPADGLVQAKPDSAAADAVDAEHKVKHRPQHGHEPPITDPKRGGAGVPVVKQGVKGERRGKKIEAGDEVRPRTARCIRASHSVRICIGYFSTSSLCRQNELIPAVRRSARTEGSGTADG